MGSIKGIRKLALFIKAMEKQPKEVPERDGEEVLSEEDESWSRAGDGERRWLRSLIFH